MPNDESNFDSDDGSRRSKTEPSAPPLESVAFSVHWHRQLNQWKVSTLANFAKISVSTVERIERGEDVSVESLDSVAKAFGYEAGYFTRPRIPLSTEEAAAALVEQFGEMQAVNVVPLKSHRAVRELAHCQAVMVSAQTVPETFKAEIQNLIEWIDLAGFFLSDCVKASLSADGRRRDLYNGILSAVSELERLGLTVLGGVMATDQNGFDNWKVAVISISPKSTDPGAPKRKTLLVDRRNVSGPSGSYWLSE